MFQIKSIAKCDSKDCTASCDVTIELRIASVSIMPIKSFNVIEYPAGWMFGDFKAHCADCSAKMIKGK